MIFALFFKNDARDFLTYGESIFVIFFLMIPYANFLDIFNDISSHLQ